MKIQSFEKVTDTRKLLIILFTFISSILLKATLSASFDIFNYLTLAIGLIIGTELFILKDRYAKVFKNKLNMMSSYKINYNKFLLAILCKKSSSKICIFIEKWKSIFKRNKKKSKDIVLKDKNELFEQFNSEI